MLPTRGYYDNWAGVDPALQAKVLAAFMPQTAQPAPEQINLPTDSSFMATGGQLPPGYTKLNETSHETGNTRQVTKNVTNSSSKEEASTRTNSGARTNATGRTTNRLMKPIEVLRMQQELSGVNPDTGAVDQMNPFQQETAALKMQEDMNNAMMQAQAKAPRVMGTRGIAALADFLSRNDRNPSNFSAVAKDAPEVMDFMAALGDRMAAVQKQRSAMLKDLRDQTKLALTPVGKDTESSSEKTANSLVELAKVLSGNKNSNTTTNTDTTKDTTKNTEGVKAGANENKDLTKWFTGVSKDKVLDGLRTQAHDIQQAKDLLSQETTPADFTAKLSVLKSKAGGRISVYELQNEAGMKSLEGRWDRLLSMMEKGTMSEQDRAAYMDMLNQFSEENSKAFSDRKTMHTIEADQLGLPKDYSRSILSTFSNPAEDRPKEKSVGEMFKEYMKNSKSAGVPSAAGAAAPTAPMPPSPAPSSIPAPAPSFSPGSLKEMLREYLQKGK